MSFTGPNFATSLRKANYFITHYYAWFRIIPFSFCSGCRNGVHLYSHELTSADSSRGAGDCCRGTSWIPGRCAGPATLKVQWSVASDINPICYNILLHIISYHYIDHDHVLLRTLLLHCEYIFAYSCIGCFPYIITKSLLHIIARLLHDYYMIVT